VQLPYHVLHKTFPAFYNPGQQRNTHFIVIALWKGEYIEDAILLKMLGRKLGGVLSPPPPFLSIGFLQKKSEGVWQAFCCLRMSSSYSFICSEVAQ